METRKGDWRKEFLAVLRSYEMQKDIAGKAMHSQRVITLKTLRAYADIHDDPTCFVSTVRSYMETQYKFKGWWWSLFLLPCPSQLYRMIHDVLNYIGQQEGVNVLKLELENKNKEIAQLKINYDSSLSKLNKEAQLVKERLEKQIKDERVQLQKRISEQDKSIDLMRVQLDKLLSDQDSGVINLIHTLEDEVKKQWAHRGNSQESHGDQLVRDEQHQVNRM